MSYILIDAKELKRFPKKLKKILKSNTIGFIDLIWRRENDF